MTRVKKFEAGACGGGGVCRGIRRGGVVLR